MERSPADSPTAPLRAEHRELLPHIEALAAAGKAISVAPLEEQRREVEAAYRFLTEHLLPHASAEDAVLYAEVDRLIGERGGTRATDTMRRDHEEVARLAGELGEVREQLSRGDLDETGRQQAQRVLFGLHTLIRVHFAKEEEVYLPLLDRELSAEEGRRLFARMGEAAHRH